MKDENKKRVLFDAVTQIDEDLIDEATAPRSLRFPKYIIRAAAVAAAFAILITALAFWPADENYVTGPGLLTITVQAADLETGEVVIKELDTREFFDNKTNVSTLSNYYPGIPLLLSVDMEEFPPEEITFKISVSSGVYHAWWNAGTYPQVFSTKNNTEIYWYYIDRYTNEPGQYTDAYFSGDFDYVFTNITIFCEGNIIGYAVFCFDRIYSDEIDGPYSDKINGNMPLDLFRLQLVDSASFPKVDGEYQDITQEYLNERIAKANLLWH